MNNSKYWRDYFEEITDNKKNYKLFIETAYGCHGSCQGCPLSIESRNSQQPKWELDKLENALKRFAPQLTQFRIDKNFSPIENLAITIGPAENLYFEDTYLENLALICKNFAKDIQTKNFHLAVSTSGLFSENKVKSKLQALSKHLEKHELSFAYIINLRQFEKTPSHYFNFAEVLFNYTHLVELEINMDVDIHSIKKETLEQFSKFVNQFPFVQLDFAYAINEGNQTKTYLKNHEFVDFISQLRDLTLNDQRQFFSQWHSKLKPIKDTHFDFLNNFNNCFENIISSHIRLNAMGEWHFAKNILGTLYYDQTFGFSPLASQLDNPLSTQAIKKFKSQLVQSFNNILSEHQACDSCEWKNICLNSGFMSYAHFSPKNETSCSNPANIIFDKITH